MKITKRMLRSIPQDARFGEIADFELRRLSTGAMLLILSVPSSDGRTKRLRFELPPYFMSQLIYYVRRMVWEALKEAETLEERLAHPLRIDAMKSHTDTQGESTP